MALTDYINQPGFIPFLVRCVDDSMVITDIGKNGTYEVIGTLQDFYLLYNDKKQLGKYYKTRFVVLEGWTKEDSNLASL